VERIELEQPRGALYGAGAQSDLLSIHPGEISRSPPSAMARGASSRRAWCAATG
jgi:hypothetical protein